jgi:glycosyltransferase involved in cell wall biosynthesis
VILEAGVAGIPPVATNVGSCREIIEGRPDEDGRRRLANRRRPVAPGQIADAVGSLLLDPARRRCGETLRARVATHHRGAGGRSLSPPFMPACRQHRTLRRGWPRGCQYGR